MEKRSYSSLKSGEKVAFRMGKEIYGFGSIVAVGANGVLVKVTRELSVGFGDLIGVLDENNNYQEFTKENDVWETEISVANYVIKRKYKCE